MSALPRAGWLALGALATALAGTAAGGAAGLLGAESSVRFLMSAAALLMVGAIGLGALVRGADRRWLALVAGALAVLLRTVAGGALAIPGPPAALPPEATAWIAQVESVGTPAGGSQRAIVVAHPAGDGGPVAPAAPPGALRLYVQLPRFPELTPGDVVRFVARAEALPASGGFASYLQRLEVAGTAHAPDVTVVAHLDDPLSRLARLRATLGDWLARVLPEPQAGLAAGIVVGLRERVGRDVAADFTAAGLSHVVAISGWNIALVGGAVAAFARPLPRRPRSLVVAVVILGYTLIAGAGPSVVRAAVMAALVLLARELGRPGRAAAVLGLAIGTMLIVEPATIADPGFQLSAAATAGLLAWSARLEGLLLRHLPARTPRWLCEALAVSLAAQAATLPLVVLDFGRLSLVSPLANLVAAPLITPVMAAGMAALVAGGLVAAGLPAILLAPLGTLAALVMGCLVALAHAAAGLPYASIALPGPASLAAALLALLGMAIAASATGRRQVRLAFARARTWREHRRAERSQRTPPTSSPPGRGTRRVTATAHRPRTDRLLVGAALLPLAALLMTGLAVAGRADGRFHMAVLDVGQGDAILLTGDHGSRVLVDAGPDADRMLALLDSRLPAWDRRLDLVVLTHPHEDHAGGLALLLERYRIGAVIETGMRGPGPAYRAFAAALEAAGRTSRQLTAGERLHIDDAVVLLRWPLPATVPRDPPDTGKAINDSSIVLDIRYGRRRFLLTGDIEEEVDPQLLARGIADGQSLDVLKVAHHGSRTATTAAFLSALRPRLAIISVGAGNTYGHPAPETLARLAAAGARILRTDLQGTVEVNTDGADLRVQTSRALGARSGTDLRRSTSAAPGPDGTATVLATIGPWPSPPGTMRPPRSSPSTPLPVSLRTRARSPTWPPSSAAESRLATAWWTVPWSRPPPSCTTSTSCSPETIPCGPWGTVTARRAGSPSGASRNSGRSWPHTPSAASWTTTLTGV